MRIRGHFLPTSLPIKAKHFDAALASADPRNWQTCPIAQALAEAIPDAITLPEVAASPFFKEQPGSIIYAHLGDVEVYATVDPETIQWLGAWDRAVTAWFAGKTHLISQLRKKLAVVQLDWFELEN
jgi:hypothetical protein